MNYIAEVTNELYRYFLMFNEKYFENKLPDVIITIQKARANNYGHFTKHKIWEHTNEDTAYELNIAAHSLHRNVEDIAGTILHEMIHYYHNVNDIRGCNNNVHNKKFKSFAESLGFVVEQSKQYGWGHTTIDGKLKEFIINEIKPNSEIFKYARIGSIEVDKPKKERQKKTFKYVCETCGLVAKAGIDAKIRCETCDELLEMEE